MPSEAPSASVGLERTLPRDAYLSPGAFEREREAISAGQWICVGREEAVPVCEAVQRGMSSRVFDRGFYAPMEDASLDIRRYVSERVEDGEGGRR